MPQTTVKYKTDVGYDYLTRPLPTQPTPYSISGVVVYRLASFRYRPILADLQPRQTRSLLCINIILGVYEEAGALPCGIGGLCYTSVKMGHWSLRILTYICDGACSVVLAEKAAECVDCALTELLRLVLVLAVIVRRVRVLGRDELGWGREELGGRPGLVAAPEIDTRSDGHSLELEAIEPFLKAYQPHSLHSEIMTHCGKISTCVGGTVYAD
jgi:hypothetical protein